jgi:hypothetical protein
MTKRQRSLARLSLIAAFLFLGTNAVFSQQLYDPAIWGDDLEAGERLYHFKAKHSAAGHPQEWGYDILGVRYLSGTSWSTKRANTSGNANNTYIIYNKPVYAMDGGTVVACWRNAPENANGGATHAQVTNKRIGLGGNMVWVREDDGEMVLYAHAITGTIPAAICPNNGTLFASPYASNDDQMPAASLVAAANQVRVERGDFLFRAGNSGNSSEPHLHIHKISNVNGSAVRFNFRRGLFSPGNTSTANLNVWNSYAGGPIPQGPLMFWPPRRLTPEYARHGFQSQDYQRLFLHLLDSGFQLKWLDTYSVGSTTFMNFVWHPGTDEWRAAHLMNETDYKAYIKFDEDNHFDPVQIETSLEGGGNVRYSVTSIKNKPGGWRARHLLPASEHITVRDKARSDGLSPASISVVSIANIRFYTVLYNNNDIGDWRIEPEISEGGYQQVYNTQAAAGRRPIYLNAYMHNGNPFISAIFASKAGTNRVAKHGMSEPDYQAAYNQNRTGTRLTMTVTSFDNAQQQHRYAAVWGKP